MQALEDFFDAADGTVNIPGENTREEGHKPIQHGFDSVDELLCIAVGVHHSHKQGGDCGNQERNPGPCEHSNSQATNHQTGDAHQRVFQVHAVLHHVVQCSDQQGRPGYYQSNASAHLAKRKSEASGKCRCARKRSE